MLHRLAPRVFDRLGRRGIVLFLFGLAWLVQGAAYFILTDTIAAGPRSFFIERLPLWLQGAMWLGSGLWSIVTSLQRHRSDTNGFLAVSIMPMLAGASYLVGGIAYALQSNRLWELGAFGFSVWAPIILALAVVASWPEPVSRQ